MQICFVTVFLDLNLQTECALRECYDCQKPRLRLRQHSLKLHRRLHVHLLHHLPQNSDHGQATVPNFSLLQPRKSRVLTRTGVSLHPKSPGISDTFILPSSICKCPDKEDERGRVETAVDQHNCKKDGDKHVCMYLC